MRRALLLTLMMITATIALAQKPYRVYCSLSGASFSQIDYGQESLRKNTLVDENGDAIYFNSIIGAMNYMSERGWQLLYPYTTMQDNVITERLDSKTIWIFYKEALSAEEITEGITTRLTYSQSRY